MHCSYLFYIIVYQPAFISDVKNYYRYTEGFLTGTRLNTDSKHTK